MKQLFLSILTLSIFLFSSSFALADLNKEFEQKKSARMELNAKKAIKEQAMKDIKAKYGSEVVNNLKTINFNDRPIFVEGDSYLCRVETLRFCVDSRCNETEEFYAGVECIKR